RNAIGRSPVRGFESHPLRSKKSSLHAGLRHAGFFFCLDFGGLKIRSSLLILGENWREKGQVF
ncbi:MAG: hypothetical protein IJ239_06545, partial [Eubacterium sp.]|nr:hypothetical protein [Eubacterium sp.]